MQAQTKPSTQTVSVSESAMREAHLRGAIVPPRKTITREQMEKIHLVGASVPAGYIVV